MLYHLAEVVVCVRIAPSLGRRQAVRQRPLEPLFEGSNPSAPAFLSIQLADGSDRSDETKSFVVVMNRRPGSFFIWRA